MQSNEAAAVKPKPNPGAVIAMEQLKNMVTPQLEMLQAPEGVLTAWGNFLAESRKWLGVEEETPCPTKS